MDFAEANVVGNEQIDARHLDRADDWIKLIVLDLDATAERGLNRTAIGGRRGTPVRTASRKASSRAGSSKPTGSGRAIFSWMRAQGSSSQMT